MMSTHIRPGFSSAICSRMMARLSPKWSLFVQPLGSVLARTLERFSGHLLPIEQVCFSNHFCPSAVLLVRLHVRKHFPQPFARCKGLFGHSQRSNWWVSIILAHAGNAMEDSTQFGLGVTPDSPGQFTIGYQLSFSRCPTKKCEHCQYTWIGLRHLTRLPSQSAVLAPPDTRMSTCWQDSAVLVPFPFMPSTLRGLFRIR